MNEAGNIRPLIDEICSAFAGRQFEIIYIDDASNDATADDPYLHGRPEMELEWSEKCRYG